MGSLSRATCCTQHSCSVRYPSWPSKTASDTRRQHHSAYFRTCSAVATAAEKPLGGSRQPSFSSFSEATKHRLTPRMTSLHDPPLLSRLCCSKPVVRKTHPQRFKSLLRGCAQRSVLLRSCCTWPEGAWSRPHAKAVTSSLQGGRAPERRPA